MSTPRRSALLLGLIAALAAAPAQAAPSSTPVPFPNVDGTVQAMLVDGRTAYIGGHFSSVGNSTGPLAFLDPRSGKVRREEDLHPPRCGVPACVSAPRRTTPGR